MKIVGEWDGETIWRPETAEEKLQRRLVEVDLPAEEEAKIAVDYQLGEAH